MSNSRFESPHPPRPKLRASAPRRSAHFSAFGLLRVGGFGSSLQRLQRGKRMILGIGGGDRRLEHRTRLARIGIDRPGTARRSRAGRDRSCRLRSAPADREFPRRSRRPRRPDRPIAGICSGGAKIRSIASSMSFSIGSSVTTQVCPIRARTRPGDMEAAAALRRHVEATHCADRISRRPATSAMASRAAGPASMSRCNPVSGICATMTGTRQGSALVGRCCSVCSLLRAHSRRRRKSPRSRSSSVASSSSGQGGDGRLGIGGKPPRLFDLARRSGYSCTAPAPAASSPVGQAPDRRPPRGRRRPRRRPACASAR